MVLSSAAASTQTTILPTARTTLSMATYRAIPRVFAKMHPRYLTPTVSTLVMGGISIAALRPVQLHGGRLPDPRRGDRHRPVHRVLLRLTGFACAWYYRKTLTSSARNLWLQGILPVLGGLIMYFAGGWSIWADWDYAATTASRRG